MFRLDETRASVTKYCFFLIKMSGRPAIDVYGYLISSARTPSVQALFGEKSWKKLGPFTEFILKPPVTGSRGQAAQKPGLTGGSSEINKFKKSKKPKTGKKFAYLAQS